MLSRAAVKEKAQCSYRHDRGRRLQRPDAFAFMISQKAKYALRALIALAKEPGDGGMQIAEIARSQKIPKKFLEQILLELKHQGILASRRGKNGGYALLKPPGEITFGAILRLIDGPIAPLPCLSKIAYRRCDDCLNEESCEVRAVFNEVAIATRAILDRTSLEQALTARTDPGPVVPHALNLVRV